MGKNRKNIFSYLDMYGQPIQFSYRGSTVFSSSCGVFTSIIVMILIIIYSGLLLGDVLSFKKPRTNSIIQADLTPPIYYHLVDFPGLFNDSSPYIQVPYSLTNTTSRTQVSVGFQDLSNNLQYFQLDPRYFIFQIYPVYYLDGVELLEKYPLFFDRCKRFINASDDMFQYHRLNETYCVYSPFYTQGDNLSSNYTMVKIGVSFCQNNTYYKFNKQDLPEFKRLKLLYNNFISDPEFPIADYFLTISSSLPNYQQISNFSELFKDYKFTENTDYISPYTDYQENYNSTDNNYTELVCAPQSDIIEKVQNTRIVFYYTNNIYNATNFDTPYSTKILSQTYYPSSTLQKSITLYFQNDISLTWNSIIPPFISNQTVKEYFMSIDESTFETAYSDVTEGSPFFKLNFKSYAYYLTYERKYMDIFEILGLIGGLSRIFILIGFVCVYYFVNLRFRESLINEFYSVIEPDFNKEVSKTFQEYLDQRIADIPKQPWEEGKKENEQKNTKQLTVLDEYFGIDLVQRIKAGDNISPLEIKKYEVVYEVFKNRAFSGFKYSSWEIYANMFCFCCLTKRLRLKNKIYARANHALEKDTDFISIIRSVQEFETVKKAFLDEAQVNLFNSLANDEITAEMAEKKIEEKKLKAKIKAEYEAKINEIRKAGVNAGSSPTDNKQTSPMKNENNMHSEEKVITTNYSLWRNMCALKKCLDEIKEADRVYDEVDAKLIKNLVNKELADDFIAQKSEEKAKQVESFNTYNKTPINPRHNFTEHDIRNINRKFGGMVMEKKKAIKSSNK